jgi:hypothetical protein
MAKQVFDSPDLLRLIYSFGDPEHRKFTKNLQSEIESNSQNFQNELQTYLKSNHGCIWSYLEDCYSIKMIKKELTFYKRCFCCTRHSIHMPILSNKKVMMTGPSVFENRPAGYKPEKCRCPCRSLSRNFIMYLTENLRIELDE